MTDASTHGLREDAQRIVGCPSVIASTVQTDPLRAEVKIEGEALPSHIAREIADVGRDVADVSERAPGVTVVTIV